jgi:hypothetical protein
MTLEEFLEAYISESVELCDPDVGLCSNIFDMCGASAQERFLDHTTSWNKYSGSFTFPIFDPSSSIDTPNDQYSCNVLSRSLHKGTQLKLRKDLCRHVLSEIKLKPRSSFNIFTYVARFGSDKF